MAAGPVELARAFPSREGYRGIAISDGDDTYYGWLRYSVDVDGAVALLAAAVETEAGAAIVIPESSSLALLALGAAGAVARRRRN